MNSVKPFPDPWRRMQPHLENIPAQKDWAELPVRPRAWWCLKIIEHYVPNALPPESREDKSYYRETAFCNVPNFDVNDRNFLEALAEVWNWLHQYEYMRSCPVNTECSLITTKGFKFVDNDAGDYPEKRDLDLLHSNIAEQVREKYLSGPDEFRAVTTDALVLVFDRVVELSQQPRPETGQDVSFLRRIFGVDYPEGLKFQDNKTAQRRKELFAGLFATFRHAPSHTFAGTSDKTKTLRSVVAASILMEELDEIEKEITEFKRVQDGTSAPEPTVD